MWHGAVIFNVIVLGLLQQVSVEFSGRPTVGYQERGQTSAAVNPYSKLDDMRLIENAKAIVKDLRSLNDEFRRVMDPASAGSRSPAARSLATEEIQNRYEQKFAGQLRDLEMELVKRLSNEPKPNDISSQLASMLIKSGRLTGADPAATIAAYIDVLTIQLSKKNPAPRK